MRQCGVLLLLLPVAIACRDRDREDVALEYVGSATCAECHSQKADRVAGTAHSLAMQVATDSTVPANFDGARVSHHGVLSEFFVRDGKRFARTQGTAGTAADFEITHTLGVFPLQQYLARFPNGRYQMLPIAWDTRTTDAGGQRWFHVSPADSIPHTDELHWTGPQQTWNYMCADCHVTGLQRNYDLTSDTYATTWKELGVRCEACHGPGSRHLAWARDSSAYSDSRPAQKGLTVDLTAHAIWRFNGSGPIARRTTPLGANAQPETCGVCHSRRETLVKEYVPGRPLLATHRPVLLDEDLYHADGQLQDEVYEYGSFLQSRMYRAGVTCSDCHDAATQKVLPGNAPCAKCHQPATYDTEAHHFHAKGSTGASCVGCHMPPRTYMVVDPRHDHSIRRPRPDLSLRIGTPNACTTCHTNRSNNWAARAVENWYGKPNPQRHYGDVIDAARRGVQSADTSLIRLAADTGEAGIVRATAVSLMRHYPPSPDIARALQRATRDTEPLLRLSAAMSVDILSREDRLHVIGHLLEDSLLAIRVEAARALAPVPDQMLPPGLRNKAAAAFEEFTAAQLVNADRPESHLRLGVFYTERGRADLAEHEYREAIRVDSRYAGGYLNLAELYRTLRRDAEGERVLRAGLSKAHRPAVLHHSLGLLLVRARRLDEAITELSKAVELEPDVPRFAHVYAVALQSVGRTAEGITILQEARRRAPLNREMAEALASMKAEVEASRRR